MNTQEQVEQQPCQVVGGVCQAHDAADCPFHSPKAEADAVALQDAQKRILNGDEATELENLRALVKAQENSAYGMVQPPLPTLQVMGPLKAKAYVTDAGFDLPASELTFLSPYEVRAVPTGIRVKIPAGYFGRIVPRSSAARRGIEVIDGTIDAGYTGELFVMAKATSSLSGDIQVAPGTSVGQLLLFPVVQMEIMGVDAFLVHDSERGEKGFGSTGL